MAKIIAQTRDGYLIDFSHREIARLVGHHSEYSHGAPKFQPGDDLQVNAMWDQMTGIEAASRKLNQAAAALREVADMIDKTVVPVIADAQPLKGTDNAGS